MFEYIKGLFMRKVVDRAKGYASGPTKQFLEDNINGNISRAKDYITGKKNPGEILGEGLGDAVWDAAEDAAKAKVGKWAVGKMAVGLLKMSAVAKLAVAVVLVAVAVGGVYLLYNQITANRGGDPAAGNSSVVAQTKSPTPSQAPNDPPGNTVESKITNDPLEGTYIRQGTEGFLSLTFSGNQVTLVTAGFKNLGMPIKDRTVKGTYSISGNTLSFDWEEWQGQGVIIHIASYSSKGNVLIYDLLEYVRK